MSKIIQSHSKEAKKQTSNLYENSKNLLEINKRKTCFTNLVNVKNNRVLNIYVNENKDKNNNNKINNQMEEYVKNININIENLKNNEFKKTDKKILNDEKFRKIENNYTDWEKSNEKNLKINNNTKMKTINTNYIKYKLNTKKINITNNFIKPPTLL